MKKIVSVLVVSILSFIFYLGLTAGSGAIALWSLEELLAGLAISIVVGITSKRILTKNHELDIFSPGRWIKFITKVLLPLTWQIIKSNIDVATRVITGKINPGIVKINSLQKNDLGVFMLATSITMTPGTLTVDADNNRDLYVHWINVTNQKPSADDILGGNIPNGIKKVMK